MRAVSEASLLQFASDSDQDEFDTMEDTKDNVKTARSSGAKKSVHNIARDLLNLTDLRRHCRPGACVDCKSVKVGTRRSAVYALTNLSTVGSLRANAWAIEMPPMPNQELTLQTSGSEKEEGRRVSGRSYAEAAPWYLIFTSTHEELQEKAHNQDLQIQQLLLQYDRLQADNKIRQWISRSHPQASGEYPSVWRIFNSLIVREDRTVECYKWLQGGTSPEDASAIFFSQSLF